jgi:hypothetical protein
MALSSFNAGRFLTGILMGKLACEVYLNCLTLA